MIYNYEVNDLFEVLFGDNPDFSAFVKTAVTHEEDDTVKLYLSTKSGVMYKIEGSKFFDFKDKSLTKKEVETIKGYDVVTLKEYNRNGDVIKEKQYNVKEIIFV